MDSVRTIEGPIPGYFHILTGKNGSGKSRYLAKLSETSLEEVKKSKKKLSRLVCLSGTVHDKFPKEIVSGDVEAEGDCIYLGYKVNNNMFSEISPFRRLFPQLLSNNPKCYLAAEMASELLEGINLSSKFTVRLRRARGTKKEDSSLGEFDFESSKELKIDLREFRASETNRTQLIEHVLSQRVHLSDLVVNRIDKEYRLSELSSGERLYLLTILGLCFCSKDRAMVLFDEPENSLHPEWQLKIMRDIQAITSSLYLDNTVVISTHSPLIAASLSNNRVLSCNLPHENSWKHSRLHGKASEAVLYEQFELKSSRSEAVVDLLQICLTEIAHGRSNSHEFQSAADQLEEMNVLTDDTDPLHDALLTVQKIRHP